MNKDLPARLNSIQALRGFAAVLVVFFHIAEFQRDVIPTTAVGDHALISGLWDRGFAGVDLFFVISGFIMVYVTRNVPHGLSSAFHFLKFRITRIYPLWWIYALLMMFYFWLFYGNPADISQSETSGGMGLYLTKSLLLIPQHAMPVLVTGWSLIHEMWFYLVFSVILLLPRRWLLPALSFWGTMVIVGFTLGFSQPFSRDILSLATAFITLEFIGGGIAAWVLIKSPPRFAAIFTFLGALALLMALSFYTDISSATHLWERVVIFGVPGILLVYGAVGMELQNRLWVPRWQIVLGDWSYSLYLSHYFVISGLRRVFPMIAEKLPEPMSDMFVLGTEGVLDNLLFTILAILGSVFLAGLSFRLIERPLIKGARRVFS
jgi:peptidoglycan/LPS O-acetylase OafA/YrhL